MERAWENLEELLGEVFLEQIAALPEPQQEALGDAYRWRGLWRPSSVHRSRASGISRSLIYNSRR